MLLCRLQPASLRLAPRNLTKTAPFSVTARTNEKSFPPRIKPDENDITESFLKGTGPGGQKINKTSSAVQLKHLPTGIVVKCQDTRSREQNRRTARRLLGERLEELEKGSESRTAIKAERARGKKASADKKKRRKYRRLEEEKSAAAGYDSEVGEEKKVHGLREVDVSDVRDMEPKHSRGGAGEEPRSS